MREKLKSNTNSTISAHGARGAGDKEKVPRRSVYVADENNSKIMRTRGNLMSNEIDVSYASVLNLLVDLGFQRINESPWSEETKEIVRRYLRAPLSKNINVPEPTRLFLGDHKFVNPLPAGPPA